MNSSRFKHQKLAIGSGTGLHKRQWYAPVRLPSPNFRPPQSTTYSLLCTDSRRLTLTNHTNGETTSRRYSSTIGVRLKFRVSWVVFDCHCIRRITRAWSFSSFFHYEIFSWIPLKILLSFTLVEGVKNTETSWKSILFLSANGISVLERGRARYEIQHWPLSLFIVSSKLFMRRIGVATKEGFPYSARNALMILFSSWPEFKRNTLSIYFKASISTVHLRQVSTSLDGRTRHDNFLDDQVKYFQTTFRSCDESFTKD